MKTKNLHPTQEKLLKLLADHADDPVTFKELQEMLEVSSTSVVAHHMQALEKKGYLKRNPYNPKDYQVIAGEPENPIARLNMYGLAACGPSGSVLDGDPIERVPVSSKLVTFPIDEAFMVEAKGNSMEPRIYDGDLIIARKTIHLENGKVYVCINNGEALIKKVQIDGENKILRSFNSEVMPFIAAKDFRIEGEVRAIISRRI